MEDSGVPERRSIAGRKKPSENGNSDGGRRPLSSRSSSLSGERIVRRLRLSRTLTMPENSTVH
ncbi:hypothetical protein IHE45_14G096800 [Dioscorea alata]|uniref:Uncharacterized protein n=1 Tax=Dioscorea alata TaxID=55571 RepID=A0ACB7UTL6_DIOAL|nr:hypothetical protein IHE45_14G096800 [Dioscorea alata]